MRLSVNIDHVATVRQARMGDEPDPLRAAHEVELGGADGVTVHLREDRRHIQDEDVFGLKRATGLAVNFEMAATDEMVDIAQNLAPTTAMLVPEGRAEVTTEGGLDVVGQAERMGDVVTALGDAGMLVSAFLDAEEEQIRAAKAARFDIVEVHTGPYAHAFAACRGDFLHEPLRREYERVRRAGALVRELGMRFNAGHALNYLNVEPIASLEGVEELHIGHAVVSRAVFVGLRGAVSEMRALLASSSGV